MFRCRLKSLPRGARLNIHFALDLAHTKVFLENVAAIRRANVDGPPELVVAERGDWRGSWRDDCRRVINFRNAALPPHMVVRGHLHAGRGLRGIRFRRPVPRRLRQATETVVIIVLATQRRRGDAWTCRRADGYVDSGRLRRIGVGGEGEGVG